jgi:hypothetical protein
LPRAIGSTAPAAVVWGMPYGDPGVLALLRLAALAVSLAFALRVWGSAYLTANVVWDPNVRPDRLIVAGPFRFVRNPLYLGNLLMAFGIGLLAPPVGFAAIVLGNLAVILALQRHENEALELRYGETFRAYRAAVPALVPRWSPATVPGSATVAPSWAQAVEGELAIGAVAAGTIWIAAAGRSGTVVMAALVAAALAYKLIRRR